MAKQTTTGGVLGKLNAAKFRQAHEAHKNDETEYSKFGELPAGIEGGVARLVEAKFDLYKEGNNTGEPFFYAAGVVVTPVEFTDRHGVTHVIEGLRTSIGPIPMCDTKNREGQTTTLAEHYARILNELRKLGVATASLQFEQLEATVARLKQIGPYFKFRTWQSKPTEQYPDPRVNHDWQGIVKVASGASPNGRMADATPAASAPAAPTRPGLPPSSQPRGPARPGPAAAPPSAAPSRPAAPRGPARPAPAPTPPPQPEPVAEEQPAFSEFSDLESLVERAAADDGAAQEELTQLAAAAGVEEQALAAQSWQEVAELIVAAQGGEGVMDGQGLPGAGDGTEPAAEGEWVPAVTEVYAYRPLVKGKPSPTQVLVEVVEVFEDSQTVTLKNTKNQKVTYMDVPWDVLETAE